jgi:F-type H+-transporting ATPase subunit b
MDDTIRQLGELALGAIPTIILFICIWILYRFLVHGPLVSALAERRTKTVGAVEKAKTDIAAAEQKTAEYERRISDARIAVLKSQESSRQKILEHKAAALAEARAAAETSVATARKQIQQETEAARVKVKAESSNLASEIIRAILRTAPARQPIGGRG